MIIRKQEKYIFNGGGSFVSTYVKNKKRNDKRGEKNNSGNISVIDKFDEVSRILYNKICSWNKTHHKGLQEKYKYNPSVFPTLLTTSYTYYQMINNHSPDRKTQTPPY